jgi:uncharacterized protein (DUF362 family)
MKRKNKADNSWLSHDNFSKEKPKSGKGVSKVIVVKSDYVTVYSRLKKALEFYDLPSLDADSTIAIKINLCDARIPDTGAITHPLFLDTVLKLLREMFSFKLKIKIVESDATVALPDLFIKWFGFEKILKKWNAEYVNLSKDKIIYKKSGGKVLKKFPVPKTLDVADYFITLPKLKTNSLTKITCSLKNQFGCLPFRNKARYHKVIDDVIAEINSVLRPDLCIVDGIISHVGVQGPAFGYPIRSNLILLGTDPVAIDTVASKILGFNPLFVEHIKRSAKMRVGTMRYDLIGKEKITPIYRPNFLEWHLYSLGAYLQRRAKGTD